MTIAQSARAHASAVIDPRAEIGEGVEIGPHVVIEGPVTVGPGCVIRAGAQLYGPLTLGRNNHVHSYAVLGDAPQHLKYAGEPTRVEIGDNNIFREYVTVHRGTTHSWVTKVGSHNFLMANSHVAHDCVVGDRCVMANGAVLGGHVTLEDNVMISGNAAVHQHVRIGRLALLSGVSGITMDLPPFFIMQRINVMCGVNIIGMRRAGISNAAIDAVRKAYRLIYGSDTVLSLSLPVVEKELGHVAEVAELVAFIRAAKRGISRDVSRAAA